MNLSDARNLVIQMVATGVKHQDYEHTVNVDKSCYIYITGEGIAEKLRQIVQREDDKAFAQRVNLTISITPAVTASLEQPFEMVARNDRVRKAVTLDNEAKQLAVETMMQTFYGAAESEDRGINAWLKSEFRHNQFIMPNSWTVIEWDAVGPGQLIEPRPFVVEAAEAFNYKIVNSKVQWLWVRQDSQYMKYNAPRGTQWVNVAGIKVPSPVPMPKVLENIVNMNNGDKFTLYDTDYTIVLEQFDRYYMAAAGLSFADDEEQIDIKGRSYVIRVYTPNLGFCPAFRNGYIKDDRTKGRTFVNPWHKAECYLQKSLKTVSELDLTTSLQAVPQRFQYVPRCEGESKVKKCNAGKIADGSTCKVCKGTGYKPIQTSAQDAILIPMPDEGTPLIDLEKLSVTKGPPIDLVRWQNEYVLQLEQQCHQAMYNSQVLTKKVGSYASDSTEIKTATEDDNDWEVAYNTIRPYTAKVSEVWVFLVKAFIKLANSDPKNATVYHLYLPDFKLKGSGQLMRDLKAAVESGAPSFLIASIISDLADIVMAGDDEGQQKYWIKAMFEPFIGLSQDQIVEKLTSSYVLKETKVMYENSEQIFQEIEDKHVDFIYMKYPQQKKIVEDKLKEVMQRLDKQNPTPDLGAFGQNNPANGNQDNSGENAGNDEQNNVPVVQEDVVDS